MEKRTNVRHNPFSTKPRKEYARRSQYRHFFLSLAAAFLMSPIILAAPAYAASGGEPTPIAKYVGHLLSGSGEWRAQNPNYSADTAEPEFYGMNYRWGPYKHHVTAEIVSIYPTGRTVREWTMFITHNPVLDLVTIEQTGANGVYFRGELEHSGEGRHTETGLIYLPNGAVKSVRDEVEMLDRNTRISRVFERDLVGGWTQVREWTWTQIEKATE